MSDQPQGITLTDEAASEALKMQRDEPDYHGLSLRVYLEGKGCDGFYYGVSFDKPEDSDLHFDQQKIDVIVDPESYEFIEGSTIEWVDDERGRGFLVENPQHRKYRGKFYKKKSWQQKLAERSQPSQET